MEQELYAFWSYDQYPYCLWGKIDKFKDDKTYINSYQGWFRPFKIVEGESARALIDVLASMRLERESEISLIRASYNQKLKSILPEVFKH